MNILTLVHSPIVPVKVTEVTGVTEVRGVTEVTEERGVTSVTPTPLKNRYIHILE